MSLDAQQSKPPPPASYSAQIGRKLVRNSKYHILEYGENTSHLIRFRLRGGKMKEALSKRFCYCTLVCCLRFLVPAWNWWLMNNNSGEKEIKITTPTNSELVGSSVSVNFLWLFQWVFGIGTWKIGWLLFARLFLTYFYRPGCGWCDSKIQMKFHSNDIPLKVWHVHVRKLIDVLLTYWVELTTLFHFSLFWCCFFVFEWNASDTIFFGSLWWRTCNIPYSSKKHFGAQCFAMSEKHQFVNILVLFFVFECLSETQVTPFSLDHFDEEHAIYTILPKNILGRSVCYVGKHQFVNIYKIKIDIGMTEGDNI